MGASGKTTIDFGAFPGKSDATKAVADAAILSGSLAEAWLYPEATADHSADEHLLDGPNIRAGAVVAGVGFTIFGVTGRGGGDNMTYGLWTVEWVWN